MQDLSRIVGDNLKRLRSERGLSLDALARISGVSKSGLGQIERGEGNPSITTVWQIAHALKVEFTALVTQPRADSVVVRKHDIAPVLEDEGRCRDFPLFPFDPALGFEVYTMELDPAGCLVAEPHPAGMRETITIVRGCLALTVAGVEYLLGEGDAIRFPADVAHEYRNEEKCPAVVSIVLAYPRG